MANQTRVGAPIKSVGGFSSAALGSALPTDAKTARPAAFQALGLIGEDGLEETEERSTDKKRHWGGGVARVLQTEYGIQLKLTFIERTTAVLKEVRGQDNVTEVAGTDTEKLRTVLRNSKMLPQRSYIADIKDGDQDLRIVYPIAQITEIDDVQYVHSELIAYTVTIDCFEDENGQYAYEYDTVPAVAAA